jgi:hypothetical protein
MEPRTENNFYQRMIRNNQLTDCKASLDTELSNQPTYSILPTTSLGLSSGDVFVSE